MRTVELAPGIFSSALGFGCAPILGSVAANKARRALTVALDEGVTHFDVARSYGYGEAESFLGRFLGSRRDSVTIATKFGIVATPVARFISPLKPLVRLFQSWRKTATVRGNVVAAGAGISGRFHARQPLEAPRLRASVEKSLRELRTDYIDYLFLHEPLERVDEIDLLCQEALKLKLEGKIRGWGLAYMREKEAVHASYLNCFDVLQFDLNPWAREYDAIRRQRANASNVFFSVFRGARVADTKHDGLRKILRDFPRSVAVCSMFNPEHIRINARSI
jgi:aryl-alcohol dehydrogenase-like predicted oxidoreductase